jgi:hypothetical protein
MQYDDRVRAKARRLEAASAAGEEEDDDSKEIADILKNKTMLNRRKHGYDGPIPSAAEIAAIDKKIAERKTEINREKSLAARAKPRVKRLASQIYRACVVVEHNGTMGFVTRLGKLVGSGKRVVSSTGHGEVAFGDGEFVFVRFKKDLDDDEPEYGSIYDAEMVRQYTSGFFFWPVGTITQSGYSLEDMEEMYADYENSFKTGEPTERDYSLVE